MISSDTALRSAIFEALAACLGLSSSSAAASALIRAAYADPENQPQPPRTRNVIYFYLLQEEDPSSRIPSYLPATSEPTAVMPSATAASSSTDSSGQTSAAPSTASPVITILTIHTYKLIIICYGPDAASHAHRIRTRLYLDAAGQPRSILRKAGIYPIPHPPQPLLLHDPENSLFRDRCDLTISLRVLDQQSVPQSVILTAPEVRIATLNS